MSMQERGTLLTGIIADRRTNGTLKENEKIEDLPPALVIENLQVVYKQGVPVIDIEYLRIPKHRITAIIGSSGCGKSTLLRALNLMTELTPGACATGKITFYREGGETTHILGKDVDAMETRRLIGMVFQRPNVFPKSIYDNVAFGPRLQGINQRRTLDEIVEKTLRDAALWEEVKDQLGKSGLALSGGQQQRLCIARAMAVEPEVILMDEPATSLDPIATGKIEDLMRNTNEFYTYVIVTHNMQQAGRVSDYTAFMATENRAYEREGKKISQRVGVVIECENTGKIMVNPKKPLTEDYLRGISG